MTTIYSYFGDKMTLDSRHSNLRHSRAGVMNIVHISIRATKINALMVPQLKGKLDGITFLVPIASELLPDFIVMTAGKTYKDTMNGTLKASVEGPLNIFLAYIE